MFAASVALCALTTSLAVVASLCGDFAMVSHISLSGEIDEVGSSRDAFWLGALAVGGVVAARVLARSPHRLNFPRPIVADTAQHQYLLARDTIAALGLWWQVLMMMVLAVAYLPRAVPPLMIVLVALFVPPVILVRWLIRSLA
jgi:hypothetical protein